ncbi:MAG: tetratricopeptide repeat protein [Bacteroidetes bacterium]|nr:tetratricopeptide repeat protein [Bacteroidota bacterium]MCW5894355.1 tetratricopeptide repeat protein [Bacteroidota bacterium]
MTINFRYTVLERLGVGGSGEVFLVEDTCRKNQQMAMKILHRSGESDTEADEVFKNEVSALLALSHPNLIRIFDFGTIRHADEAILQRRFFTMELLNGVDTLAWLGFNDDKKESQLELLLLQALSVLSYIHREGIVHFDIKPQNLVVVDEGKLAAGPLLKLADFGFSKKKEETLDISVRGTLEYTAPECLKGEECDHRLDLYSLGATFFHLLEGHPPFEAGTPVELAKRVLSEEPHFASGVGKTRTREVILGLMQKLPSRRFATAEEAARKLSSSMQNGVELYELYFGLARSSRFVGRRQELATIQRAFSALGIDGEAPSRLAISVTGPEGIGKTSVIRESLKHARSSGLTVYEINPIRSDVPFDSISEILQPLIADIRSFSEPGRMVFERFDQLIGLGAEPAHRFEKWGGRKDEIAELLARFLVACSDVFPFAVAIDNAQLLDDASVQVVRTTIRNAVKGRVFVLAAETAERATVFPPTIAEELHLGELTAEEIAEISQSVLGQTPVVRSISSLLNTLYGGTPAVVVEALNAVLSMVPADALTQPDMGKEFVSGLETKLPRTIDAFLLARFNKLSRERQLVLSILACFQFPVKENILAGLLPFHPQRMSEHLRFLHLDEFITSSEQRVFIRMKRLKDAIYERIQDEKPELHSLISATLERDKESSGGFEGLQELAFQFSGCGKYMQSFSCYERAADEGMKLFALQRSLQLYCSAIDLAKANRHVRGEVAVQAKLALALYETGSYREAIALCRELEDSTALLPPERAKLSKVMGFSASRLGENDLAQELLSAALRATTDKAEQLELRQELVGLEIATGRFAEAEKDCLQQLGETAGLESNRLKGDIYTNLGIATFYQERFDDAVECFSEAMKQYESTGERTQVINSMNNIGNVLSRKGDTERAIEFWHRALKASEDFGTMHQQALIHNNLGIAHYSLRKYGAAKQYYDKARSQYQRIDSMAGLALVIANLGEVSLAEGEYEKAVSFFDESRGLAEVMENMYHHVYSLLYGVQALLALGVLDVAEARLEEAKLLIENEGQRMFFARYRLLQGLRHYLGGRHGEACVAFRDAMQVSSEEKANDILWQSQLRLAECLNKLEKNDEAISLANGILCEQEVRRHPRYLAEANFILGICAGSTHAEGLEKPIVLFKRGMDILAKEPVTEITWKLAYALAGEYFNRGQRDRAKEYFIKTRLIVQFFLSHISSDKLKSSYLAIDQKDRVLATIDSIVKT